jgi:pyruvate,water dikinase
MGEASGRVKIVNSFLQAQDVEKGDIIVTTMTTPEITIALDKAAGIITDEGGVTCHAAIIAREYAIPCLVGTQNATKLLKDGMFVKIDCINGSVEIVNE